MSYQEIYSSPLIQQQDKPILSNNPFMTCWCWTVQIFVWIAFFVLVFSIIQGRVQGPYAFLLIYIIYVVSELCSPTLSYLIHQKSKDNLYTRMGEIFGATPSISFHCVCYHYEMKQVLYKDSKGNNQIRAERKRVDTFTDEMTLHYYSVRDVSGLFLLDEIDSVKNNKIAYIILHLEKKINFSDCISYADYILQKEAFWKRNRYRDSLITSAYNFCNLQK